MMFHRSVGFHFKRGQFFKTGAQAALVFALLVSLVASAVNVSPAYAAASLTITPITWNVIGLDSVSGQMLSGAGPENFPVGARVCNTGDAAATNLSADFVWDSVATYIDLRLGSLDPIALSTLAAGTCTDFYFEVTITRNAAAYDSSRDYHITVTADGGISAQTPANREIYVEHLVSQNRNSVLDVLLDGISVPAGGAMNLNIGQTYNIQLIVSTATNGYEQIESFINFPNTIFLINSVATTYAHDEGTDANAATKLYADGCTWDNDTTSGTYRKCLGVGKYGDTVTIDYNVTIVASSASSGTLNTLIYDFSGSSYHYNSDFALAARIYNILDPSSCTQSTIAQWTFPTDGSVTTPSTDNAVGTPTLTHTTLNGPYDVVGNPTKAANYKGWNETGTLDTASDFVQVTASTEGYYNVQFGFDAYRSNDGPSTIDILYYDGTLTNPAGTGSLALNSTWYPFFENYASVSSLDNYSGAYFRVYGYNATHFNGAMRFDNVTVTGCKLPSGLNLDKTGDPAYFAAEGQIVTYTYTLTNSGSVSLQSPYTITDDKVAGISCASATSPLEPGASTTCTGTYTTTAADVTAGSVTNVASVAATTVIGDPVTSNTATETVEYRIANFGHVPSNYLGMNLYNDGGAMHLSGTTMFGASLTSATDGINTATYTPKVTDDGVTYTPGATWTAGGTGSVDITATCPSVPCYMNAWIDWNQDGDFNEPGEQIFTNQTLNDGTVTLTFDIPVWAILDGTFYSRFRIYDQLPTGAQPDGAAMDGVTPLYGEIEDPFFTISGGSTTPVTVSYFLAERNGANVNFTWFTATETGNVGFNLYVEHGGNLELLNRELIPSRVIDSLDQQNYTFTAQAGGNAFYIEDVSVTDETRRHGPFALGEAYGGQVEADKVDWPAIQKQNQAGQTVRQNALKSKLSAAGNSTSLNLKVNQTGLYRVTYEMLRDAGLDLNGAAPAKIQLSNHGQAVPIYVKATGKFGPGAYIEFYGQALDTIYTDTNIYTLQVSQAVSERIPAVNAAPGHAQPAGSYAETLVVNNQRAFANYAPGNDAWYDTSMLAYKTSKSWDFPFQINGLADPNSTASLELVVWGVTNFPQSPDHHLVVSVNGVAIADQLMEGLVEQTLKVELPAGVLKEGGNTLQLTLPGDMGVKYDMVNLDKFSLSYQRVFQAQDGRLTFTAAGTVFMVTNLPSQDVVVYRMDKKGMLRLQKIQVQATGSTFTATFAGSGDSSTYLVTTAEAMYTPAFEAARLLADLNRPAQYLVIAHPDFVEGLGPLVQARQAQGLTVSVVDVTDLYTQYTYGVFDPRAIQQYIAYAVENLGTQYVLLVGGDTYDYRNYLGKNSISFIPSLYVTTGKIAKFVPADPLYADLDGNNVPDLAIGRFPVRTAAELDLMVNKTLAYAGKDYGSTAVFASDKNDGVVSFKNISVNLAAGLPIDWSVENIHLDDMSVVSARTQLLAAMNRGTALVTFTGHSGPASWTFSNLFNTNNAAALTNFGRPFVVVQWGCWNTYYVDPVNNYLVQSFLFSGDQGAAAVLGASTLVDADSEFLLGQLLTPRLTTPGMSLGQALRDAKLELAQAHPELVDVLLGWSLMGDPALVVQP